MYNESFRVLTTESFKGIELCLSAFFSLNQTNKSKNRLCCKPLSRPLPTTVFSAVRKTKVRRFFLTSKFYLKNFKIFCRWAASYLVCGCKCRHFFIACKLFDTFFSSFFLRNSQQTAGLHVANMRQMRLPDTGKQPPFFYSPI